MHSIYLGIIYTAIPIRWIQRVKLPGFGCKAGFQALKAATKFMLYWDDHDFGMNDSGRHYPFRKESKELFLDFFGDQAVLTIRQHEGIYHTVWMEKDGKENPDYFSRLTNLSRQASPYNGNRNGQKGYEYELDYSPYTTSDSTMLGETQWKWLEEQLMQPADVRIMASSTQFSITHNGYEAWANFPHEQQRFIDLLKKTKMAYSLFRAMCIMPNFEDECAGRVSVVRCHLKRNYIHLGVLP